MESTTQDLPVVSCICPTFHRPRLLRNAFACFLAQDYPAEKLQIVVVDDGNDFEENEQVVAGRVVTLKSVDDRFRSLPDKFDFAVSHAAGDILVVWEDDDIYLPHHVRSHVQALQSTRSHYSKPSQVLSTYTGGPMVEPADGRFHASIAFTRDLFYQVNGWIKTERSDFDQQFMSHLFKSVNGMVADPCKTMPPSYCFRYGSTGEYHGQHFMRSPSDTEWYNRVPRKEGTRNQVLFPDMDQETASLYQLCSIP